MTNAALRMTPILVFDIETVPDLAGLRRARDVPADLSDAGVLDWYSQQRRAQTGSDFVPLYLQKVVAIACALRDKAGFKIASVGSAEDAEPELIRRFFDLVDKLVPQLVSWNGGGFDLPVLHYRAMVHGISAPRYWELGEEDREFKFNNYINRYHTRHLDLMDLLALYQPRASAPLDDMAKLCGFPGKLGMDGSEVWNAWSEGGIERIRAYCETDAANTYLMFLRVQCLRGFLDKNRYEAECGLVRATLERSTDSHWREFLGAWPGAPR